MNSLTFRKSGFKVYTLTLYYNEEFTVMSEMEQLKMSIVFKFILECFNCSN